MTRRRRAMQQLGTHFGTMVHLDEWTDEELDEYTRVSPESTTQDRVYIRKTIRFLRRLSESMQRTLTRSES